MPLSDTKPWYASKTVIGSVVALLGGVLSWLKYDADAELLADVGDQLIQLVTILGALLALWGRIRATKKIAPADPDSPLPPPPPQRSRWLGLLLGWLLLAAAVALTAGGCAPVTANDYDRLYAARQTYVATLEVVNELIETGVIRDPSTGRLILQTSDFVAETLAAAETKYAAGDRLGFNFAMDRAQAALGRLLAYRLKYRPVSAGERSDLWTPPRSRRSSSPALPSWLACTSCGPRPSAASLSPRRSTRFCASARPRSASA